jgi:PKD repeat protein
MLSFQADTTRTVTGMEVEFRNTSQGYQHYQWIFEAGTPARSEAPEVTVTFAQQGLFNVSLIGNRENRTDTLRLVDYMEVLSPGLTLSPNPVSPGEDLSLLTPDAASYVEIFDLQGRLIIKWDLGTSNTLRMPVIEPGMYLTNIQTAQQGMVQRKLLVR